MAKSKKQIAKPTKKQLGHNYAQMILNKLVDDANGIRDVIEKGRALDARTGQPVDIGCSPTDVLKAFSLDQKLGVEDFVSNWATEPVPPPKPSTRKRKVDKTPKQ